MEEGVDGGSMGMEPVLECVTLRRGDDGRRIRAGVLVEIPMTGELLLLSGWRRSGSRTDDRMGDVGGKASSTGFRGIRTRLGDCEGLAGRM